MTKFRVGDEVILERFLFGSSNYNDLIGKQGVITRINDVSLPNPKLTIIVDFGIEEINGEDIEGGLYFAEEELELIEDSDD